MSALQAGDLVVLLDAKGRRYLVRLEAGKQFHTHRGHLDHDALIGTPEGSTSKTERGATLLALRPTLSEYVVEMPRGAQVIYPKDLSLLLLAADIRPGLTVVEAGAGSGALSLVLLQALGPTGRLLSIELREDFAEQARRNVVGWLGEHPTSWELRLGDVVEHLPQVAQEGGAVDRLLLDLLEPWRVVPAAAHALDSGGVLACYVTTVPQIMRMVEALENSGRFGLVQTSEAMVRPWHVDGLAVRPDHRMVAHTGFLITARRIEQPWGAARLPR